MTVAGSTPARSLRSAWGRNKARKHAEAVVIESLAPRQADGLDMSQRLACHRPSPRPVSRGAFTSRLVGRLAAIAGAPPVAPRIGGDPALAPTNNDKETTMTTAAMMLYAEIHHTPADDAETTNIDGGLDMDRETFLEELPKLLGNHLKDAKQDDEFIVTITVQEAEE